MAMNRRDFLRMSAAFTAAGMSPSLFAATKEQFTIYGAPAMPSVTIAVAAAQGKLAKQADVALGFGVRLINCVRVWQVGNLK